MKKVLLLVGLTAAVGAMAQGYFTPSNYASKNKFFLPDGVTGLGQDYSVQFLWAASLATPGQLQQPSMTPVGDVLTFKNYTTGTEIKGYFGMGANAVWVASAAPGVDGYLQALVWNKYSTYAAAAASQDANIGATLPFVAKLSNPNASPPDLPTSLLNISKVTVAQAPEPTVFALGVLGAGALLIRRRK